MKTLSKTQVNEIVEVTPNEVWLEVLKQISEPPEDFFFKYDDTLYTSSYRISNVYNINPETLRTLLYRHSSVFTKDGVISVKAKTLENSLSFCVNVKRSHIPERVSEVKLLTPKAIARVLLFLTDNETGDKLKKHIFKNFENYKMEELKKEKRKETYKQNKPSTVGVRFKTHEQKKALEKFAKDNNLTLSSALFEFAITSLTEHGYLNDENSQIEKNDNLVELHIKDVLNENLSDKEYEQIQKISDDEKVSIKEAYEIYKMIQNQ